MTTETPTESAQFRKTEKFFRAPTKHSSARDKAALRALVYFKNESTGKDVLLEKFNKEKFTINDNFIQKGVKVFAQASTGYTVRRSDSISGPSVGISASPSNLFERDRFMIRDTLNTSPIPSTFSSPHINTAKPRLRSGLGIMKKSSMPISTISSPREAYSNHQALTHRKTMSSLGVRSTDTGDTIHSILNKKLPKGFLIKDFSKYFPQPSSPKTELKSPNLTQRMVTNDGASTTRTQREWKKIGLENQMPYVPSEERERLSNFIGSEYITKLINDQKGLNALQQQNSRKDFIQMLKSQHQHQDEFFSRESLLAGFELLKKQMKEDGTKLKILRHSQAPEDNTQQQEESNKFRSTGVFGSHYESSKHNYVEELDQDEGRISMPKLMDFQLASSNDKFTTLQPLVDKKLRYAIRDPSQNQKAIPTIELQAPVVRKFGEFSDLDTLTDDPTSKMMRRNIKSERFAKYKAALRRVFEKLKRLKIKGDETHKTGLHWAVQRHCLEIATILINSGADVNAQDLSGKTPLYAALKGDNVHLTRLLLYHQAEPWGAARVDYLSLVQSWEAGFYLTKARQLNLLLRFKSVTERQDLWMREARAFFQPPTNENSQVGAPSKTR